MSDRFADQCPHTAIFMRKATKSPPARLRAGARQPAGTGCLLVIKIKHHSNIVTSTLSQQRENMISAVDLQVALKLRTIRTKDGQELAPRRL
jgi:hypothetical protein